MHGGPANRINACAYSISRKQKGCLYKKCVGCISLRDLAHQDQTGCAEACLASCCTRHPFPAGSRYNLDNVRASVTKSVSTLLHLLSSVHTRRNSQSHQRAFCACAATAAQAAPHVLRRRLRKTAANAWCCFCSLE